MSRLFAEGSPIEMILSDRHEPRCLMWQGHSYEVRQITNHWRINTAWWGEQQHRDYYRLLTMQGWLAEIFCDRLTGTWYLQRVYD